MAERDSVIRSLREALAVPTPGTRVVTKLERELAHARAQVIAMEENIARMREDRRRLGAAPGMGAAATQPGRPWVGSHSSGGSPAKSLPSGGGHGTGPPLRRQLSGNTLPPLLFSPSAAASAASTRFPWA